MTDDERRIVEWLRGEEQQWFNVAYRMGLLEKLRHLRVAAKLARKRGVGILGLPRYLIGAKPRATAAAYGCAATAIERGDHRK